jgi:hypothetical protein
VLNEGHASREGKRFESKGMVIDMRIRTMGMVALSGLFALSLAGCAASSTESSAAPGSPEQTQAAPQAVEQADAQKDQQAGEQAAQDGAVTAEPADGATAEQEPTPPHSRSSIPAGSLPTTAWSTLS